MLPPRLSRVIAVVVAVLLALALALSLVGSVDAATARPRHDLTVNAKELDSADRFVLYGKVVTDPDARIIVVRSIAGGPYHRLKRIGTSDNGRFRTRIYQSGDRLTCFKVIVPATPDHRRTTSKGASCITSS